MKLKNLMKTFGRVTEGTPRLARHWTALRPVSMEAVELGAESGKNGRATPIIDLLKKVELQRLNDLLPWSCFILDAQGRAFGKAWSATKRSQPQEIPDYRI